MTDQKGEDNHCDRLSALGQISMNYSALEMELFAFIWGFLPDEIQIAQIFTAGRGVSQLQQILRAIFHQRISETALLTQLEETLKLVEAAVSARNRVTHCFWFYSETAPAPHLATLRITIRSKNGYEQHIAQAGPMELIQIATDLAKATTSLRTLMSILEDRGILQVQLAWSA